MRYFLGLYLLLFIGYAAQAQHNRSYFRNPLGIPMQLVANFGEVRTDHFHMGFDLRTNQRENLPVYAAAEGYVSRVVIEPGGYGRAIYITHPGGYTTLYAHLNDFFPALQQFVEYKQYKEAQWEQDVSFNKLQFPVSKGQFIAYSGNTGASQGPHLHFEIRDSKTGNNVNPRLFDFPIKDNIAPFIYKLFLYDRNYSTYAVAPTEIKIKGGKGSYITRDTLIETGSSRISFGISAEDMGNSSSFRFGIHSAEIWNETDSMELLSFALHEMNYDDSRYMNASIDYRKRILDGSLIQHLSKLPGNRLSIFESINDNYGVIELKDTLSHGFLIFVKDISGNESVLRLKLRWNPALHEERFFTQETEKMIPGQRNTIVRDNIRIDFPATAFYDTVHFVFAEATSDHIRFPLYQLHHAYVPVHDNYTVSVTPQPGADPGKLVWKLVSGKNVLTSRVTIKEGRLVGSFDRLGHLTLVEDTSAPVITPSGWKDGAPFAKTGSISFSVKDEISYVETFRAEVDGKWLLFSRKGNTFTHRFDERTSLGKHEVKVRVKDIAGNATVRNYNFELREKLPVKKKKKSTKKKRR